MSLPENVKTDETVVRVIATDADTGQYGEVSYSLRGNPDAFTINSKTVNTKFLDSYVL